MLELDYFKPYCETAVWDVSYIINRKFADMIRADRSSRKEITQVSSIMHFFLLLMNLRKVAKKQRICILNEVTTENVSSILCNLLIKILMKNNHTAILDAYNGGIQIRTFEKKTTGGMKNYFTKIYAYMKRTETNKERSMMLKSFLCLAITRCFNILPTTHRLVAGDEWIDVAGRHEAQKKGIKFIYGNSYDFSNDLLKRMANADGKEMKERKAVLLDGAGPAFGGDHEHVKRKQFLSAEVWYPSLAKFLNKVEKETGVTIEIAAHYKSAPGEKEALFDYRTIHYGKTRELVRDSEFVITRMSAAISYAVIYKKPVIYIYSNELKKDRLAMDNISMMAEALGQKPVNIDEFNGSISQLLVVDEDKYTAYEKACLTSSNPRRPNVQVILEDIMGIKFDQNLFWKGVSHADIR